MPYICHSIRDMDLYIGPTYVIAPSNVIPVPLLTTELGDKTCVPFAKHINPVG